MTVFTRVSLFGWGASAAGSGAGRGGHYVAKQPTIEPFARGAPIGPPAPPEEIVDSDDEPIGVLVPAPGAAIGPQEPPADDIVDSD